MNVQSQETLIKQLREELDDLKRKNERLVNDKNELKLMSNQLEAKVTLVRFLWVSCEIVSFLKSL